MLKLIDKIKKILILLLFFVLLLLFLFFHIYRKGYKEGYKEGMKSIKIKTDTIKVYLRDTIFTIKEYQIKVEKKDTDTIYLDRKIILPSKYFMYLVKNEPFMFEKKEEKKVKIDLMTSIHLDKNIYLGLSFKFKNYSLFYLTSFNKHLIGISYTLISF